MASFVGEWHRVFGFSPERQNGTTVYDLLWELGGVLQEGDLEHIREVSGRLVSAARDLRGDAEPIARALLGSRLFEERCWRGITSPPNHPAREEWQNLYVALLSLLQMVPGEIAEDVLSRAHAIVGRKMVDALFSEKVSPEQKKMIREDLDWILSLPDKFKRDLHGGFGLA